MQTRLVVVSCVGPLPDVKGTLHASTLPLTGTVRNGLLLVSGCEDGSLGQLGFSTAANLT